jgi:hypothetical protein
VSCPEKRHRLDLRGDDGGRLRGIDNTVKSHTHTLETAAWFLPRMIRGNRLSQPTICSYGRDRMRGESCEAACNHALGADFEGEGDPRFNKNPVPVSIYRFI